MVIFIVPHHSPTPLPEIVMRFRLLFCCIALPLLFLPDNRCEAQYDWYKQDAGLPEWWPQKRLRGVHFTSRDHGVVVGDEATRIRTTDGGTNWMRRQGEIAFSLTAVQFIDNNDGFAVGERGTMLHTSDGGETWRDLGFRDAVDFTDVSFADTLIGMALSKQAVSGEIYRTSDGGAHWTRLSAPAIALNAVHVFDADNAIVVGPCESIYLTLDGGASWFGWHAQLCGRDFLDMSFVDRYNGFIVGSPGMILRTTDGGMSRDEQQSGTSVSLYGVSFSDPDHGTAVGARGTIVCTTNGGATWERSTSGVTSDLYDVCFTDRYTGTAVGDKATILRTTTGGATWIPDDRPVPVQSALQPNYPNPFAAGTTIPITLEKSDYVSLRIFDAFGRAIATLTDGSMEAGMHTLTWEALGVPAGVYYAVLRTGLKYEIRKLVLIDMQQQ